MVRLGMRAAAVCALMASWALAETPAGGQEKEAPPPSFYVSPRVGLDTNHGYSPEAPLHTIREAVRRCEPGSVVTLMSDTYEEPVALKPGLQAKPIILRADQAGRVFFGSPDRRRAQPVGITLASYTAVDGLDLTNFSEAAIKGEQVEGVVIANCRLYGNGYAIFLKDSSRCLLRDNDIWNNRPPSAPAAQVAFVGPTEGMRVEGNRVHDGGERMVGLFFMTGPHRDNVLRRNRVWGTDGILFQPLGENNVAEFNVCLGPLGADRLRRNTCQVIAGGARPDPQSDLVVDLLRQDPKFADPAWQDYRLQSDSPARGKGKGGTDLGALPYRGEVVYVKPDGDDAAEGTSLASAWKSLRHAARSLKAGQTLYLLPGEYAEPLRLVDLTGSGTTSVRAWGRGRVWVSRVELVHCGAMELGNLCVKGAPGAGIELFMCEGVTFRNCASLLNAGDGAVLRRSGTVSFVQCALWQNGGSGLAAENCTAPELLSCLVAENRQAQVRLTQGTDQYYGDFNAFSGAAIGQGSDMPQSARTLLDWQQASGVDRRSLALEGQPADPANGDFRPPAGSLLLTGGLFGRPIGPVF